MFSSTDVLHLTYTVGQKEGSQRIPSYLGSANECAEENSWLVRASDSANDRNSAQSRPDLKSDAYFGDLYDGKIDQVPIPCQDLSFWPPPLQDRPHRHQFHLGIACFRYPNSTLQHFWTLLPSLVFVYECHTSRVRWLYFGPAIRTRYVACLISISAKPTNAKPFSDVASITVSQIPRNGLAFKFGSFFQRLHKPWFPRITWDCGVRYPWDLPLQTLVGLFEVWVHSVFLTFMLILNPRNTYCNLNCGSLGVILHRLQPVQRPWSYAEALDMKPTWIPEGFRLAPQD